MASFVVCVFFTFKVKERWWLRKKIVFILCPSFPFAGCTNCVNGGTGSPNRWTMPLQRLGNKQYYLGIFFKVKQSN